MEPLAAPIHLVLKRSRILNIFASTMSCAVLFILWFAFEPTVGLSLISLSLIVLIVYEYRCERRSLNKYRAVLLGSNDQWSLIGQEGELISAHLSGDVFVTRRLVILPLKPAIGPALRWAFTDDNTTPRDFRRLRVRLRVPFSPD